MNLNLYIITHRAKSKLKFIDNIKFTFEL